MECFKVPPSQRLIRDQAAHVLALTKTKLTLGCFAKFQTLLLDNIFHSRGALLPYQNSEHPSELLLHSRRCGAPVWCQHPQGFASCCFRSDIGSNFFSEGEVGHWHREALGSPSLEGSQNCGDEALRDVVGWIEVEFGVLRGLFHPLWLHVSNLGLGLGSTRHFRGWLSSS